MIQRKKLKEEALKLLQDRGNYKEFDKATIVVISSWKKKIANDAISNRILLEILNQKGKLKIIS